VRQFGPYLLFVRKKINSYFSTRGPRRTNQWFVIVPVRACYKAKFGLVNLFYKETILFFFRKVYDRLSFFNYRLNIEIF